MSDLEHPDAEPLADWIHSNYVRPHVREQSASIVSIESNKLVPLLAAFLGIALLVAGLSFGIAWKASSDAVAARQDALEGIAAARQDAAVRVDLLRDAIKVANDNAARTEREARMLEYYLLELDAKFIDAKLKAPADGIAKKLEQQRRSK